MSSPDPAHDPGFEDLFDHAPCGYLIVADDGSILRVNATLAGWLGGSAPVLTGMRLHDILTTPARIFFEANVAPLLRLQDGVEEVVLDLRTLGGETLPVQVNATSRRGDAGEPSHTRMAVFRTGARRRYERDLQGREASAVQSLADERLTAVLREQFIAVLGHDLRNPLASIIGAARLLRREAFSDKAREVLAMMEASAERMAGLIDDVLDFARGRLGDGIVLRRQPIPLGPILAHVATELETAHPGRVIECDFDLPETVDVDADRIAQLASNLLANAMVHGALGQPVRLRVASDGRSLELSVSNGGAPIPPAAMARLFQPFFRGEVRASQQGLGLGLHIASEIAKAHGGTLQVSSDAAETRFTLTVPLG